MHDQARAFSTSHFKTRWLEVPEQVNCAARRDQDSKLESSKAFLLRMRTITVFQPYDGAKSFVFCF